MNYSIYALLMNYDWCAIISTIVDVIVGILTFFTLKAAIKYNKQNHEELEQARIDFKYSLKMHEQEKNIALLDKRMDILKYFEEMKNSNYELDLRPKVTNVDFVPFSEKEIIILFRNDKDILSNFRLIKQYIKRTDSLLS